MKRQAISLMVPLALGLGLLAKQVLAAEQLDSASSTPACCSLTTSLAQQFLDGKDLSGDERFFETSGAPPNIHFLLDTSGSMIELPQVTGSDYSAFYALGDGCTNSALLADESSRGWDYTNNYPASDPGTGYGADAVGKWNGRFSPGDAVWGFNSWLDKYYSSTPVGPTFSGIDNACGNLIDKVADPTNYDDCRVCLRQKGFYKVPGVSLSEGSNYNFNPFGIGNNSYWPGNGLKFYGSKFVFTGNYLRFNPPKYVTATAVMKKVITNLDKVRAGFSVFDGSAGGGELIQPQNPPCNKALAGQQNADRASYVNTINNLTFETDTPLAEALLNIGQYFSSDDTIYSSTFGFGSSLWRSWNSGGYIKNSFNNGTLTSENRSFCWGCEVSSVIIITDGQPTDDSHIPITKIKALNKDAYFPTGEVLCPAAYPCDVESTNHSDSYLDDVARLLYTHDLQQHTPPIIGDFNTADVQKLLIYGVGFGVDNPLLRNATWVGNDQDSQNWPDHPETNQAYFQASDSTTLENDLLSIISQVITRATSFSTSSVTALQVNRTGTSLIPRFSPSRSGNNEPWAGFLYRFDLESELVRGCNPVLAATRLDGGAGDPNDLNLNGECDEVLLDADGDPIVEDDNGKFVKFGDGGTTPAHPYWEAGQILMGGQPYNPDAGASDAGADAGSTGTQYWMSRSIWTIVDENGDGKIDKNDTPIEFTEANAATLQPYLGISDRPNECDDIGAQIGQPDGGLTPLDCAKLVIRYYRGANALSGDPTARDYDRPWMLGDIFHSSPVEVNPPISKTFCSFTNQCVTTLFSTATPLNPSTVPDAYEQYLNDNQERDKIVLVGANDGLLHAFYDGMKVGIDSVTGANIYNAGDGHELWAFVPPDLLPKLRRNIGVHSYFVDDTAMVRDVWIDENGDQQKQENEFRTVAVMGEGRGGVHHFALDLTDLIPTGGYTGGSPGRPPNQKGDFLWMWPQPCDDASLEVGESFSNYAPRPPPIGAVAIADPSGPIQVNNTNAREDWVVFFNGGYDPFLSRGRGLAMVELSTGNTLWSKWFGDGAPLSDKMRYPFAAGVAMMDIGAASSSAPDQDTLFDTATVPDFGGDVWTVRFWNPGVIDLSGKVSNWYAARSFQVQTDDANPKVVEPFTQMTANALDPQTGYLRTFLGSGDRYHLTDLGGAHCRISNPYACAEQGCMAGSSSSPVQVKIKRGTTATEIGAVAYSSNAYQSSSNTLSSAGNTCRADDVKLNWNIGGSGSCNVANGLGQAEYQCGADGGSFCTEVRNDWQTNDLIDFSRDAGSTGDYYAFYSYGVNPGRVFDTGGSTDGGAVAYDTARLHPADLLDVTDAGVNADGGVSLAAGPLGNGWMFRYVPDERTATGSAIVDGCVVWNSFTPAPNGGAICATTGANVANLYQGDFVSGAPNCAASFQNQRYLSRNVVAVPGEPTIQHTVASGQGSTQVVIMEPGNTETQTITASSDLLQAVYQLELTKPQHECRHVDAGSCE